MTKEHAIRLTAFFSVLWTALFLLLREVLPTGIWGLTTGILIGVVPRWLAKKIID